MSTEVTGRRCRRAADGVVVTNNALFSSLRVYFDTFVICGASLLDNCFIRVSVIRITGFRDLRFKFYYVRDLNGGQRVPICHCLVINLNMYFGDWTGWSTLMKCNGHSPVEIHSFFCFAIHLLLSFLFSFTSPLAIVSAEAMPRHGAS